MRRKNDSVKWTLVLVLVFSQIVNSRPQVESTTLGVSVEVDKSTDNTPRYSYRHNNVTLKLPLTEFVDDTNVTSNNAIENIAFINNLNSNIFLNPRIRTSRLIRKRHKIRLNQNNIQNNHYNNDLKPLQLAKKTNKPVIKKVVTKWTDKVKYEDLNVSHDTTISEERDGFVINKITSSIKIPHSTTENYDDSSENNKNAFYTQSHNNKFSYTYQRPQPQYSEETQVYSNNFQVSDPYNTRPNYLFTTPTPTPIITNVGYPKPWPVSNYDINYKPNKRPVINTKPHGPYNHHTVNNFSPYPDTNYDVSTFPPSTGYTDRIVIRPEEYSASSDDCPTIFVTLNNTFQGEGKEACPDLNIAVNTNVVNKNVVVESDEDTDTTLSDVFGLPVDESGSDEAVNDYVESQENDEDNESASDEELEISNYNAANSVEAESAEPGNFASPSSALSTFTRPSQPNDDDDIFSSVIDFFRPAVNAFSWLAAINPLSFSALSFLLTPLIFLVASISGIAALFAPWALSGRELPEVYSYKPYWQWDDNYKTWHLNSMPIYSRWETAIRSTSEHYTIDHEASWFLIGKEFVKTFANYLTDKVGRNINSRKKRRKKRGAW